MKSTIPPLLLARCWARLADIGAARVLFEMITAVVVWVINTDIPYQSHPVPAYVGSFIAWVVFFLVYEAVAVSTTSTTAGKWLLGIRVVKQTGGRPSFSEAIGRANKANAFGLFYFVFYPYLTVGSLWSCYEYAKKHGKLAWDKDSGPQVTGKNIGVVRHVFGYLVGAACAVGYAFFVRVEVKQNFLNDFFNSFGH